MTSAVQKLILGTAQFGLDYGINNTHGKTTPAQVREILNLCATSGIRKLDTADAYGDSQEVLAQSEPERFEILSKFSVAPGQSSLVTHVKKTLARLQIESLWAYSFHRFSDFTSSDEAQIRALKDSGLVRNVGVSLYSEADLETAIQTSWIDLIQLPFNLLDSSPARLELLQKAQSQGKVIHVRSIFLQGLFFMDPERLPAKLILLAPYLRSLRTLCAEAGLTMNELCLAHALSRPEIQGVVIGVETPSQLQAHLKTAEKPALDRALFEARPLVAENHRALLNPVHWSS